MTTRLHSPKKPLFECDRWSTMQMLASPVASRLTRLVRGLHGLGYTERRDDVMGALVLDCKITSPEDLWALIREYKVRSAPAHRRRTQGVPVIFRLPGPISLRIDSLVEVAREHRVAYRHDVVGALILAAPADPETLATSCLEYREATAGEAALPGRPMVTVLSRESPKAGPRRWRSQGGASTISG